MEKTAQGHPGLESEPLPPVTLHPDGRICLPPPVVERCVRGCTRYKVWFDDKNLNLGIKLFDEPTPSDQPIEFREGPDGREGYVDVSDMLSAYKLAHPGKSVELPIIWKEERAFIEVGLNRPVEETTQIEDVDTSRVKSVLDDYPALD